jgi:RluA family pseudouridine synthase
VKKPLVDPKSVLYSDESLIAVNKSPGLCVIPERYAERDVQRGAERYAERYDEEAASLIDALSPEWGRLFAVHRLDKDTSGVVLLARTEEAHRALCTQFGDREVGKVYHAVAQGRTDWKDFELSLPLRVDGDRYHRTVIDGSGKASKTVFTTLGTFGRLSLVEARPLTGRTHQIRVHLASQGHPVAVDRLYGDGKPIYLSHHKKGWRGDPHDERPLVSRLALHAFSIEFAHPLTGQAMRIEAPYPRDLEALRRQLPTLFSGGGMGPKANQAGAAGDAYSKNEGSEE